MPLPKKGVFVLVRPILQSNSILNEENKSNIKSIILELNDSIENDIKNAILQDMSKKYKSNINQKFFKFFLKCIMQIQILNYLKKNYLKRKNQLFWKVFKSDLDTPVSAYLKLCQNANKKNCFLLESVQDGSFRGRYSVIGMLPDLIWKSIKNEAFLKEIIKEKNILNKMISL